MRRFTKSITGIGATGLMLASAFLMPSCIDNTLDLNKDVSTEVSVGGDSLAIPIGKTDTLRLGDFLSSMDTTLLKSLEDGGYGITQKGHISQKLDAIDASSLKIGDQTFSQKATVNFGNMNVSDFKIPGFFKKDTIEMNIPTIDIGDVAPSVAMDQNFTIKFSDYKLDPAKLSVADLNMNSGKSDMLSFGGADYDNPIAVPFTESISKETIGDLSVNINYDIDVPGGITNIYSIDLQQGAVMEITMALDTASMALSSGTFTPEFEIDPSNLFNFNQLLSPLTNGKITFSGAGDALSNLNNYSKTKSYYISGFHNLPPAANGKIIMNQTVTVGGSIDATGTVKAHGVTDARNIDLKVIVSIKNVNIENMDMDIPAFSTTMSGSSSFDITNNNMPAEIKSINKIYLEKTPGSLLPNNLVISMSTDNLPTMVTPDYKINDLTLTFPDNFAFTGMAGHTYSVTNAVYDPAAGLQIKLDLSQIDMSAVPINNGTLNWNGSIAYSGDISFGGRMNSREIGGSDPNIRMKSESAISLKSADVTTNDINENLGALNLPINLDVDIADQVKSLGNINMKPGAIIALDFTLPNLPLPLQAKNLKLKFSDLFEFTSNPNIVNNEYIINGDMPTHIELEIAALHINKDLVNGKLLLKDSIMVDGGFTMVGGDVNSDIIKSLNNEKLIFKATVSDLYIASTNLQLKSLEANFNDSTTLNMEFNDIPAEIVRLDSILLKDGASLKLDISVSNMPNLGGSALNTNIQIKFPKLLAFAAGEVDANNVMTIAGPFVDGKISKTLKLKGMLFGDNLSNGKLTINDKLNFNVGVSVFEPSINSEELTGAPVDVAVNVVLGGIQFDKVYGIVDPKIPEITSSFAIGSLLPDMLRGDDVVLDIANPVISMAVKTNIGIPVDAGINLVPKKNGTVLTDNIIAANLSIPRTANPSEFKQVGYWLAPSSDGKPDNYNWINANIMNLFKPIPDTLAFAVTPSINTTQQHYIDLSASYQLDVDYEVKIPFSFGKDLNIKIETVLDSISTGLGEMTVKANALELFGVIYNSIPLNLDAELIPMDKDDNILSEPMQLTIKAGAPDGSATASNVSFKLNDLGNTLQNLNKMKLVFTATSNATVAGTPIKGSNFIIADLKARVPGGIQVKL